MPGIPKTFPAIDLNRLAQVDLESAELGFALNAPHQGGVNLDGNNQALTYDEFLAGARTLAPWLQNPQTQAALARLQSHFTSLWGGAPTPSPAVTSVSLLKATDIKKVNTTSLGIDVGAALLTFKGRTALVAESFDVTDSKSQLTFGMTADGAPLRAGETLFADKGTLVGSPSWAKVKGRNYLYFLASDDLMSPPRLFRAPFNGTKFGAAQALASPSGLDSMMSWPKVATGPGALAMVFRDSQSRIRLATSVDGRTWKGSSTPLPQGAMHHVTIGDDGTWALTYQQQGARGGMTSFVSFSTDGKTFSRPQVLSATGDNVHDTTLLQRSDGGFDAYYISAVSEAGFSLFRRAVREDGSMGPEQRLTDAAQVGEASKPSVVRQRDGRVTLVWAAITARANDGSPSRQEFMAAVLDGDAP